MRPAEVFSSTIEKITQAEDKLPFLLFAVPVLTCAYWIAYGLLFLFFGYIRFFAQIGLFLQTVSKISYFLLGIYMILLYLKGKIVFHAAAGVALIIRSFLPFVSYVSYGVNWGLLFVWLICGLLIAAPSYLGQEEDEKAWGRLTAIIAAGFFLLSLLVGVIPSRSIRFFNALFSIILYAGYLSELLLLLTLVIHDTDQLGGVLDNVEQMIGRLTGKGGTERSGAHEIKKAHTASHLANETNGEILERHSEVTRSTAFSEQESISEPAYERFTPQESVSQAVILSKGASAGGKKQYKTVAGPVALTISRKDSYESGVKQYAAIIDSEAVGGWKLDSIYEIPVTKKAGCLASLFGQRDVTVFFNMLIFSKEE